MKIRGSNKGLLGLGGGGGDATRPKSKRRRPVPKSTVAMQYRRPESFTDLLPWVEYLPDERCVLLEDGRSVGVVIEVEPIGCEARPQAFLATLQEALHGVLSTIVEHDHSPWVLQVYVQDEFGLRETLNRFDEYISEQARGTRLTEAYARMLKEHMVSISHAQGVFEDTVVTGSAWGARLRRTRLVLYRRFRREEQPFEVTLEQLRDQVARLLSGMEAAGIRATSLTGRQLYEWLLQWFNPAPAATDGDPNRLAEIAPYPGDEELPFGRDLAELLTLSMPESDPDAGVWRFDARPHVCVPMQALRRVPEVGLFTAERRSGDQVYSLFDRLPSGTTMVMTLTFRPQDVLRAHVADIKKASIGDGAEAVLARENAEDVEIEMARGDRLIPTFLGFYLQAADDRELRLRVNNVSSLLLHNGIQTIARESDLLALDTYVRCLPMNYEPAQDKAARRSRLVFSSHVARMLPFYGRSRGTGNPGFIFYNRGGEPLTFDPLNKHDRRQNGHMLVLGPTGAGKSATLVYLILQAMAVWRPRIFIIEAGNSFGLLCDYLRDQGLSVHESVMSPGSDVSLPPFAGALSLLDSADPDQEEKGVDDDDDSADETRDLLGEMELAARIMITGGDAKEDARMSRADRMVIRRAILAAAADVRDSGREQVLTEDVAHAMRTLGGDLELDPRRRERAVDMADSMALFCTGMAGKFFNRPGVRWPDADVTHLEMGILQREGYEDQLTVAYTALMNHINGVVEANQHQDRPTIVITDEGHIITTNPLLAPYVVKITKMWRKYGAWYWIATQNLEDFPDASRRMLNMLEWWICLVMPKEEVDNVARFRALTDEQRLLLQSARKEGGKYTEGVVLTNAMAALFRNVPPAIALALAQTEQHEKAERRKLMVEHGCSEVEAALLIAETISRARAGGAK